MPSNYSPIRIAGTLALSYRDVLFGFDKVTMEDYGLRYYSYGEYKVPYKEGELNLILPIFIRVGDGGWLAIGDEEYWLSDDQIARELFLIYTQAVWDSEWIPYGWYWDSGCAFYISDYGVIKASGTLETELIPSNIVDKKIIVRILTLAHSSELDKDFMIEKLVECEVP